MPAHSMTDKCLVHDWLNSSLAFARVIVLFVCSYFITEDEKQATYTGREQRHGVWILPFLVAGLFDLGLPKSGTGAHGSADSDDGGAAAKQLVGALCGSQADAEHEPDVDGPCTPSKTKTSARPKMTFNWDAYRVAFPDTPLHAAVTAMFAEYAMLVGRITRRVGAASGEPMTLSKGISVAQQAQDVIVGYVTPILGHVRTTKIHRVLCHVLHSVKYHGNIMNASTSVNEQGHKADKQHYSRTNKRSGYTRQLVRHAYGTRAVLRRYASARQAEDKAAASQSAPAGDGGYTADDETVGSTMRRARTTHLPHERVAKLSTRAGLASRGSVLCVPERERIAVPGHVFNAQLPVGDKRQVVRASLSFFGREWYVHVEYRAARSGADHAVQYDKVRVLVRYQNGDDFAVVAAMERVVGADQCPLSARGRTQLKWSASRRHDDGDGI